MSFTIHSHYFDTYNKLLSACLTLIMSANIVSTSEGLIRGRKLLSVRGGEYFSFQGIPYAKPPIGDLRFKPPQPLKKWDGIRDAFKEGPSAPAFHTITQEWVEDSSEDCLYLNVYSPKLDGELKPVLFWIHGGGFTTGSGNAELYGPDYLVVEDVVVVTCNYRLGPLGFLSLQTPECPGNNGLKDLVSALQWVHRNISSFGGNPNNITIFGESAGGAAVHYLVLSKKAKGLFHKAISQSGVTLNPWALARKSREKAFKLGEILGCKTNDDKKLLEFLKKIEPKELVVASNKVYKLVEPNEHFIGFSFVPTVEPDVEDAFISKHPDELLKSGDYNKVPYIIGANTLEGIIILKPGSDNTLKNLDEDLVKLVPNELGIEPNTTLSRKIRDEIRKRYFPAGFEDKKFIDVLSCIYFLNGIDRAIEHHSNNSAPLYVYQFSYNGEIGLKALYGYDHLKGTCHGDELSYLFKVNLLDINLTPGTPDHSTMLTLTKLWTNFAKYGNPTPETNEWKPLTPSQNFYLDIDENLTLRQGLEKNHMDFWKNIYQIAGYQDKSKL